MRGAAKKRPGTAEGTGRAEPAAIGKVSLQRRDDA